MMKIEWAGEELLTKGYINKKHVITIAMTPSDKFAWSTWRGTDSLTSGSSNSLEGAKEAAEVSLFIAQGGA